MAIYIQRIGKTGEYCYGVDFGYCNTQTRGNVRFVTEEEAFAAACRLATVYFEVTGIVIGIFKLYEREIA